MNELLLESSPRDWRRIDGIHTGEIRRESAGPFRLVFYRHRLKPAASALAGTRVLFFSDLHIRPQTAKCFPGQLCWNGAEAARKFLLETIGKYHPDHLFFGGDMMAYLCNFGETLALFRDLPCPGVKAAVYGNWDLIRAWLPKRNWRRAVESAGIHLLVNEPLHLPGMRLFGLDDIRKGSPEYLPPEPPSGLECVLVHNPDTMTVEDFAIFCNLERISFLELNNVTELDLSGMEKLTDIQFHHGGQIRIPGFGAVVCSSIFWKKFEYGLYENRFTRTRLLVTAGLGVTFIRRRIFCPPEAVIIDFEADTASR